MIAGAVRGLLFTPGEVLSLRLNLQV